jgi:hypothetical protein
MNDDHTIIKHVLSQYAEITSSNGRHVVVDADRRTRSSCWALVQINYCAPL